MEKNYLVGLKERKLPPKVGQSKKHSFMEILVSTLVGYFVALLTQYIVFPLYGIQSSHSSNVQIALIFTIISIIRGYIFRRVFNKLCR